MAGWIDVWMYVGGILMHGVGDRMRGSLHICMCLPLSIERAATVCFANQNRAHLCHPTA
jgi:hypothetical protein